MRPTTVWSILCGAGWLFLNVKARIALWGGLSDGAYLTAAGLQFVASWFLIAAFILIVMTAYKNLFGEPEAKSEGASNNASYSQPGNGMVLNAEHVDALNTTRSFLKESNSAGARNGNAFLGNMDSELNRGQLADRDKALGYLSRSLMIAENLGSTDGPVVEAIRKLKSLCTGSEAVA